MNNNQRRFAISDIHGCLASFKSLLKKINYSKSDTLYLLGDYIDRGPESKGVIDYIWQLQAEGYQVYCLLGNHEQLLLDSVAKPSPFYKGRPEVLANFEVTHNQFIPKKYIQWMKNLKYYIELDDYILVHAGLNFEKKDPLSDLDSMIWIRYWYDAINTDWLDNRIIIHGHTPTKQLDIKRSLKELAEISAINIDAGCVFQSFGLGHLCVLNLDTKLLTFQARIDEIIC